MPAFTNNKRGREPLPEYRRALTAGTKRRMFVIVFQQVELLDLLASQLKPETWPEEDRLYGILWKISSEYYQKHGVRIPDSLLTAELDQAQEENPELLTIRELDELNDIMEDIYDKEPLDAVSWCQQKMKEYLQRLIAERGKDLLSAGNAAPVCGLPKMLLSLQAESEQIDMIGTGVEQDLFIDGWEEYAEIKKNPIGVGFIDAFLGGGLVDQEVYGLIAPYGTCKTTLAIMMAANYASMAYDRWMRDKAAGVENPVVDFAVFASYETPAAEFRQRLLGYVAQIPREYMDSMVNMDSMSTSDNLRDYEKERYKEDLAAGRPVYAEQDRIRRATPWLNLHLQFMDMTAAADGGQRSRASLGIVEIKSAIDTRIQRLKTKQNIIARCGFIEIDYVNAAVRSYMERNEIEVDKLRHEIAGYPRRCYERLAVPYGCPVMLMQQFSGEANAKSAGIDMHHTESAECKTFAENLNFCFTIGNLDSNQRGVFCSTKHRRYKPMHPTCIRVVGEMNEVVWDPQYQFDAREKAFVHEDDLKKHSVLDTNQRKAVTQSTIGAGE